MSKKCKICNGKLNPLMIDIMNTCRCKGIYCRKHIFKHNCQYNYKELFDTKDLVNVSHPKVLKI